MIRYMVIIISPITKDNNIPDVRLIDCNINSKEEAEAEREWFIVTNDADPDNVKVVEYKG